MYSQAYVRQILFPLLFIVLFLAGCSDDKQEAAQAVASTPHTGITSQQQTSPFRTVSVTEAKQLIETRPEVVILDVRTPQELREGAIEGSTLVPFWAIMQNKLTLPKETPIMLVCAVGGRSFAAGQMMVKYGFKEVYNVSGGLSAWKEAGLPVKYQ